MQPIFPALSALRRQHQFPPFSPPFSLAQTPRLWLRYHLPVAQFHAGQVRDPYINIGVPEHRPEVIHKRRPELLRARRRAAQTPTT